jgi:RimJ/RimL family protein N-acetyltransferase
MFPDLTCDDIFHIETKRLWLRWPRVSDVSSITAIASLSETARMTATIPHPYPPGTAEQFVFRARSDNAAGNALVLIITLKSPSRNVIGLVSAVMTETNELELGYILAPSVSGKGFATEAVSAFIDTIFNLTRGRAIRANTRTINPASRRVLEKCGFTYVDSGLDLLPARGGLHPCDRFVLERKTWAGRHHPAFLAHPLLPAMEQQNKSQNRPAHNNLTTEFD